MYILLILGLLPIIMYNSLALLFILGAFNGSPIGRKRWAYHVWYYHSWGAETYSPTTIKMFLFQGRDFFTYLTEETIKG